METNTQRGRVTVPLGGKERAVRFGLRTQLAFSEQHGVEAGELHRRLSADPFRTLIDLMVVALVQAGADDLPAAQPHLVVADWLDDAPQDVVTQLTKAALNGLTANPLVAALAPTQAPPTDPQEATR